MTQPINMKAIVTKVVRANGKAEAQMVVTIPVSAASEIPLGQVIMTIKAAQEGMFPPGAGGKSGPLMKGDDK